ncbi:zonular occludens toxin domain-containing protein [Luteimonas fraxinea]|uniref:zonular occludens toxin domain-containing protein n=1 Tax=Luteimonas fraxinea TaxID=2901869 RepID=UPI001E3581AB|nr:zonular occludens toxin domain-containing protein [Luteimonas fraxinea]MCD9125855.1 Zona occludens toxin [Luteimonas fraxinea]
MIFAHEGLPRSGKSYEAVLFHIVPALRAKRHVYVRVNGVGEQLANMAAYLGETEETLRELVHVMGDQEVVDWLVCDTNNDGSMVFPHIQQGALVVVDEAQEYWPTGRANLPERAAKFFSKHGHASLDIVLQTQDVKDLHRLVVRRIAKKNTYTKLDSLGADTKYSVRFFVATGTGKFESMGSETRTYDPVVWGLYHGVQPGVDDNPVYKSNSRTLWKTVKWPAIFMVLALVVGIGFLARFFMGGGAPKDPEPVVEEAAPVSSPQVWQEPSNPPPMTTPAIAQMPAPAPEKKGPPGIAYVTDLLKTTRARHAGSYGAQSLVEFRAVGGGAVLDRLTTRQLEALGWTVEAEPFGVRLTFEDTTVIATAWPIDLPYQQSERTAQNIRAAGGPLASASEQPPRIAAVTSMAGTSAASNAIGSHAIASYGDFGQQTGNYVGQGISR